MPVLDAALLILFVAWLTGVIPGWAVFIAFMLVIIERSGREESNAKH